MPLATAVIMAFLKDVIADAAAIARERRAVFSARLRSAAIIAYEFSPSADVESFLASGELAERSLDFGSGIRMGDADAD